MNNAVNEYTGIDGASIYYDESGNLYQDEADYEYGYDYENRLTSVTYTDGTPVQVAHFEYDALGRMISSQLQFDTNVSNEQTLKYYYDGLNAIAEYDESDNLSRRYVHGTSLVDERAILLEGDGSNDTLDTYYYFLRDLYSVAGLIKKNGTLVEAYVYDTYGDAGIWGYRDFDFDRDGDVYPVNPDPDYVELTAAITTEGQPTTNPCGDYDMDGDTSFSDALAMNGSQTSPGEPPVTLYTSAVGNPFFFTGRRWHFLENDFEGKAGPNKVLQYNRARHYDPVHGRWLQRDPSGYIDGMNLYEYVRSNPGRFSDPYGLVAGPAGTRIKIAALSTIGNISTAHASQTYYQVTGLNSALHSMAAQAGRATFHDRTEHWFRGTPQVTSSGEVYLSPGEAASQTTVFHEMTHLLQVRVRGGFGNPARDEGEASAAEMMLVKLTSLVPLEEAIKQRASQSNCGGIARKWSAAAFSFNNVLGTQTEYGVVTAGDIGTMRGLTGFGLNCKRLVQRYNGLMRSSGYFKKPCCLQPLNCSQFNPAFH